METMENSSLVSTFNTGRIEKPKDRQPFDHGWLVFTDEWICSSPMLEEGRIRMAQRLSSQIQNSQ